MYLFLFEKNRLILYLINSLLLLFFVGCVPPENSPNVNSVQAQERNRTPDRQIPGTNPLELLKLGQVQQELGLTREQIEQLKQAKAEIDSKLGNSGENVPPNPRIGNSPEFKQAERGREMVAKILTPDQLNRFKQISLQVYGWAIMSKEEVTEILVITPEQEQKLQVFREQNKEKLNNSLQVFKNKNPQECQKVLVNNYQKLIAASQESNQQIRGILRKDQIQTLDYMRGQKFDLNLTKIPAICP